MSILDLPALAATAISTDPFAHVIVRRFVKPEELGRVTADLPPMSKGGSFPIEGLRIGPVARQALAELAGPEFRAIIAEKFGLDLSGAATMMTLRGNSRERDGQIHTDSVAKRVTILLYLNKPTGAWDQHEGCLRLLRGPDDIENFAIEVPPVDGTLLVFPNGPTTWHGHKRFVGQRYVVQMNYMTGDAAARNEMRRHKLSAFVKRLTAAA